MEAQARSEPEPPVQAFWRRRPALGKIWMRASIRTFDDYGFVDGDAGRIDVRAKGIKAAEWVVEGLSQSLYRAISECYRGLYRI